MQNDNWKIQRSVYLLQDTWLSLRSDRCETASGHIIDPYYVIETSDWVHVVAFDTMERILLTRQYRHGVARSCLEIPAGIVDATDPDPETAAKRELLEETGYEPGSLVYLGALDPNPARQNNRFHTFLALNAIAITEPSLEPSEQITLETASLEQLMDYIQNGEFTQALHLSSLFLALVHRGLASIGTP